MGGSSGFTSIRDGFDAGVHPHPRCEAPCGTAPHTLVIYLGNGNYPWIWMIFRSFLWDFPLVSIFPQLSMGCSIGFHCHVLLSASQQSVGMLRRGIPVGNWFINQKRPELQCGAPVYDSVQLVEITPISLWFMIPITI